MRKLLMIGALALVATGTVTVVANAAGQTKSDICHLDRDAGTYELINVADPALDAHFDHGDGEIGEAVPGLEGKIFDENCVVIDAPSPGQVVARA